MKKTIFAFVVIFGLIFTACEQPTGPADNTGPGPGPNTIQNPNPGSQKYTVTFDSNGGTSVSSQTADSGAKISKPADPTKGTYNFAGWFRDSDLVYAWNFNADTVTANITLYARWTAIGPSKPACTITFNSNGGTAIATQIVTEGSPATRPYDPVREGYTLVGWYKEEGLSNAWNFERDTVTNNITLYAKWTLSYTVTFNIDSDNVFQRVTGLLSGAKVSRPDADPVWPNLVFDGWYKESTCNTPWDFANDTVTRNLTIWAKWIEQGTFSIDINNDLAPEITGPTISILGANGVKETETITITGAYSQIRWFLAGTSFSGTGSSITLNAANYIIPGKHFLTVEVLKEGRWYSTTITFTVVQ